jgi:tetratricopeptide (TPR) repeat protein
VEFDRCVQIRLSRPNGGSWKFGSGYLVAPRLVLTAGHVVRGRTDKPQGTMTVSRPSSGPQKFAATVRWCRIDEVVDAALVEVENVPDWQPPASLQDLHMRPPQRWGHLIGTRPHPVAVAGFPRMQKDSTNGRLDEQLTGNIQPGTGSLAGRYEVFSVNPTIAVQLPPTSKASRWSGISGAALLCGDLLCGIVRRDRQATGGTRLIATPLHTLLSYDGFTELITEHCQWEPILEPAEPTGLLTPAACERDLRSPAVLLRADVEAVAFHGRERDLQHLLEWCQKEQDSFSVRLLIGPGGQGKSRLARHLAATLRQRDWVTGYVRTDLTDTSDSDPDLSSLDTTRNLMLVVDYAEIRPRLVRRLIEQLRTTRHRSRLLLLARSDGEWRTDTLAATAPTREILATAPVIDLAPLIPGSAPPDSRAAAFSRAVADLAPLLRHIPHLAQADWSAIAATVQPPDDLTDSRYDSALTLQMTALVTLLQHGPAPVSTSPGAPAEATLLRHEQRYWEETSAAPAFRLSDLRTATLKRAVAAAIICGAANQVEAEMTVRKVPGIPSGRALDVAEWLRSLYPPYPDRYWGFLQPDRVAEYHASLMVIDASAPLPLPAIMNGASPDQQTQGITVLSRSAIAHSNAGRIKDCEAVLRAINTVLDTVPLDHQTLQRATAVMPHPSRPTAALAVRLATAYAHACRQLAKVDAAAYEPDLAASLANLGICLTEMGEHSQAAVATEEAVRIRRKLATSGDATYLLNLAVSLTNLGAQLTSAGQRVKGLTNSEQATKLWRRLAAEAPALCEPNLARSLSNLGGQVGMAGKTSRALDLLQEAVAINRRLAASDPIIHEPGLAMSLSNLGVFLSETEQYAEAAATTWEAVKILRRLAASNPAAHEPDLARYLSNLGNNLAAIEQYPRALLLEEEAVGIWRRLVASNPAAYEPSLALSLSNLGNRFAEVGKPLKALAATEQAVGIWRRLVATNPAAHEPDLARSLSNLGNDFAEVGKPLKALAAIEEAVAIRRRLATVEPAAHEPGLAKSLSKLSIRLAEAGEHARALTTAEQALKIWTRLAASDPAAYEEKLFGFRLVLAGMQAYSSQQRRPQPRRSRRKRKRNSG